MFVADPLSSCAIEAYILLHVLSRSCIIDVHAKSLYSKLTLRGMFIRAVVSVLS